MDNFDDLENSSKEQLIEEVESLRQEVNHLKEEKSKRNLFQKDIESLLKKL